MLLNIEANVEAVDEELRDKKRAYGSVPAPAPRLGFNVTAVDVDNTFC